MAQVWPMRNVGKSVQSAPRKAFLIPWKSYREKHLTLIEDLLCQALLILSALNKITHSTFLGQVLLSLILQMKSLWYRVVKKLAKGRIASECWSQDLIPGSLTPE